MVIFFRSCTSKQVHPGTRIVPKSECTIRCLRSVVASASQVFPRPLIWVLDDHSLEEDQNRMRQELEKYDGTSQFAVSQDTGNGPSMLEGYHLARSVDDLVYLIEDDYLHYPYAIKEMLAAHNIGLQIGADAAVHPTDDPDNYKPGFVTPTHIVFTEHRHWRTNNYAPFTVMMHSRVLKKFWLCFEAFSHYGEHPDIHENTTCNRAWRSGEVTLLTPLPTLAHHMQFPENRTPVEKWEMLWSAYEKFA